MNDKQGICDLQTPEMSKAFAASPLYEKSAIVKATLVQSPREVVTIVGDGLVETTVIAQPGEYVVQNPGGEEYVLLAEKFSSRYSHVDGDTFRASGTVRAFRNPTGGAVTVIAPWGEEMHGAADCFFAQAEGTDRYIIESGSFASTYHAVDNK